MRDGRADAHAGARDKGLGERRARWTWRPAGTPQPEWPQSGDGGDASVRRQRVKERQRGGPLSACGAPTGVLSASRELASRGRGSREPQPGGGSCAEAGRAPAAGTQVGTRLPAPQPTRPHRRVSDGQALVASAEAIPQAPDRRSDTDAVVPVRNAG